MPDFSHIRLKVHTLSNGTFRRLHICIMPRIILPTHCILSTPTFSDNKNTIFLLTLTPKTFTLRNSSGLLVWPVTQRRVAAALTPRRLRRAGRRPGTRAEAVCQAAVSGSARARRRRDGGRESSTGLGEVEGSNLGLNANI